MPELATPPRESAVIVPLALPRALERLRRAWVPVAHLGVPAHVTLLYPFIPPSGISASDVASLGRLVASETPFDVRLTTVRTFPAVAPYPGTTYLEPEPAEPFVRLTRAIWSAFPGYPPFEGAYDEIIPHLTLADDASRFEEIEVAARLEVPIGRRVEEAWLIVEGDDGRWARRARLALGRRSPPPARPRR